MTLKSRAVKINQVAASPTTREVYRRDCAHRVYHVDSTRTGKPYQVIADFSKNGVLEIKAELYSFDHTEQPHPGNVCKTTVVYQALGALKKAAKLEGKTMSFCKDYQSAVRLLSFGGELVKITNLGNGVVWATVR